MKKMDEGFERAEAIVKDRGHEDLWSYFRPYQTHLIKFCKRYGMEIMSESNDEILVMKEL